MFKNLKIGTKLLLRIGALVVGLLVFMGYAYWNRTQVQVDGPMYSEIVDQGPPRRPAAAAALHRAGTPRLGRDADGQTLRAADARRAREEGAGQSSRRDTTTG